MPEYLFPGVYLVEVPTGVRPIEGVDTSTVDFLGDCLPKLKRALAPLPADRTEHDDSDPGVQLLQVFAWLTESLVKRVDAIPDRARPHAARLAAAALALVNDRSLPDDAALRRVARSKGETRR